jgi:hypothetical protein
LCPCPFTACVLWFFIFLFTSNSIRLSHHSFFKFDLRPILSLP